MSRDEPGKEGTPKTDPKVEESDQEGSSGAEEGISPWSPEAYDADPEGPTTSTEDP